MKTLLPALYLCVMCLVSRGAANGNCPGKNLLPYEALRCLVDNDEAGGKRIAAALIWK